MGYHSPTAMGAVDGAIRKRANLPGFVDMERLADRIARREIHSMDIRVTWADAKATGACDSGIKNWCAQVGIDHAAASVPLADVLTGYQRRPMQEALAVILHVIRHHHDAQAAA
ncbi:hypothetical protein ANFP_13900 [Acidithiobacillus ferrooxidans]|nr:hypothetical protein ANFP_13900 [Acidithiobacillus ferrooxidans]